MSSALRSLTRPEHAGFTRVSSTEDSVEDEDVTHQDDNGNANEGDNEEDDDDDEEDEQPLTRGPGRAIRLKLLGRKAAQGYSRVEKSAGDFSDEEGEENGGSNRKTAVGNHEAGAEQARSLLPPATDHGDQDLPLQGTGLLGGFCRKLEEMMRSFCEVINQSSPPPPSFFSFSSISSVLAPLCVCVRVRGNHRTPFHPQDLVGPVREDLERADRANLRSSSSPRPSPWPSRASTRTTSGRA